MTILTFTTFLKMLPSSFLPFVSSLQANWRKKGTLYWLRLKKKKKKLFHVFPSKVFGALFPPFLASILWQGLVRIIIQPHLSLSLSYYLFLLLSLSPSLSPLRSHTHKDLQLLPFAKKAFLPLSEKSDLKRKTQKKLENTFFVRKWTRHDLLRLYIYRERNKKIPLTIFTTIAAKKMCFFFSIRVRP